MLDLERRTSRPAHITIGVWFAWVVASMIGYLLGEWLGEAIEALIIGPDAPRLLSVEGRVEMAQPLGYVGSILGGVVAGVVLGAAQGLVLLPYIKMRGMLEWIIATTIGRMARWVALFIISQQLVSLVFDKSFAGSLILFGLLVGAGIIAGLTLGYAQSVVLRRRVERSTWWIWANIPGPVFTALVVGMTLFMEGHNVIRDCTTPMIAAISAGITGIALNELLNRPTKQAEWYRTHNLYQ